MKNIAFLFSLSVCVLSLQACSVSLDQSNVKARNGAPLSTHTEVQQIPHSSDMPILVFGIEPFIFSETIQQNSNISRIQFIQGGEQIAAKFTTALANVGNFSVVDSGLKKSSNGLYNTHIIPGEVGPFIVRATVTEFTHDAETSTRKRGALVYRNRQSERTGMLAVDFRVVNGATGRVMHAFKSEGTFSSASSSASLDILGIGGGESKSAQSDASQALTVIMNDAVKKIHSFMTQIYGN